MVHPVAARGFGAEAEAYERSRPSYPPEAVAWLTDGIAEAAGGVEPRFVDLAAGTPKLTRLLRDSVAASARATQLVAVEPVAEMRDRLRRTVPEATVVAGVAEAVPLAASSTDLLTVAQAFHWFDAPAAVAEAHRVLRAGGRLGLVWNARERTCDWVDRLWSIVDRVERPAPWRGTGRDPAEAPAHPVAALAGAAGFGPAEEATFHHEQTLSAGGVVERVRAVSHVAVLAATEQAAVLDEVRSILTTHPEARGRDVLAIPYRVDAYRWERDA